MSDDKRDKGQAIVDRLFGEGTSLDFPEPFRRYTLEHLFGDVWQGEALALEERSLITCTILVALAREPQQKTHFTGAKNLGIPREKLVAMIVHAAHYAGWPNAVSALRTLEEVWPETG